MIQSSESSQHVRILAPSIVIPAFNASATIDRAIASVLAQSESQWELVVVDDGSDDGTASAVAGYTDVDPRIRLIEQKNRGVAAARNAGVQASRGRWVVFLDADDELMPEYLSEMGRFSGEHPGFDIYHPDLLVRGSDGVDSLFCGARTTVSFGLEDLLDECVIAVGGAMVDRGLIQRLRGFRSDLHCEDYDLWLRAMAQGARALYLPKPLYVYHQDLEGRRSQDTLSGVLDLARAMQDLLDAGVVPEHLVARVRQAVREKRALPERILRERALHEQAEHLRAVVERIFGTAVAPIVLRLVHSVSWVIRPVRRILAGRQVSRK